MTDPLAAYQRALVLCAHTDDELACAGTMIRLVEAGSNVRYVAYSCCEESVPEGFEERALERECRECCFRLGLGPKCLSFPSFRVRHLPAYRQTILEHMVYLRKSFDPTLVLLPASGDIHQDHAVIHAEGFRAFRNTTILGYELPQNLTSFSNTAFVSLTVEQLDRKVHALAAYESQGFRRYATEEFIRSLAVVRGTQADVNYAEAFEVVRLHL
jgi:LmbE family N-acetylglucosaminyl deacetylase